MNDKTSYLKPLPGFILIQLPEKKEKIEGFVVVKDQEDKRTWAREGKVLAVGTYKQDSLSNRPCLLIDGKTVIYPEITGGETIYFSSFADHPVSSKLTFIKYSDVLGIKCTK